MMVPGVVQHRPPYAKAVSDGGARISSISKSLWSFLEMELPVMSIWSTLI